MSTLALLSLLAGLLSLVCLAALHITSPEFKPSWRMVSEYALGKYKWLLTAFFVLWGASSILLAVSLWSVADTIAAIIGNILLVVSGVGAICGGLFDLNDKRHGLAFLLGVPTLPAAALILSYSTISANSVSRSTIILAAHATLMSLVIMAIAMMVMFAGFKKAGVEMKRDAPPLTHVPKGVIALGGYANRLLVVCYILWALLVAYNAL